MATAHYGVFNIDNFWWVYGEGKWTGPFGLRTQAVGAAARAVGRARAAGLDVALDLHDVDGGLNRAAVANGAPMLRDPATTAASGQVTPRFRDRPTTLERAFQLARSGEVRGIVDIKARLRAEGYGDAATQLTGPKLISELRRLCVAARGPAAPALQRLS